MVDRDEGALSRRQFVGAGSAAAIAGLWGTRTAAAGLGQPVSVTEGATGKAVVVPGPPPKKLRIAIVGCGKFGVGVILPALSQSQKVRINGFVSGNADKARALANFHGVDAKNLYNYDSYDKLVDNPDIDAVYVILPNSMHEEFTVRAARAGKHVLCEKPLANSVASCERMIKACREAKVKLMTAYRSRYEAFNETAIAFSREQKYGPLQRIVVDHNMDVGQAPQWRLDPKMAGGGSLVDIGIYSLNAARYLAGEEPVEINAMTYNNPKDARFRKVEQSIVFQLRFPSGVLANCSSSYSMPLCNRYHVNATDGWYSLDPATPYHGQRLYHGSGDTVTELRQKHNNQFAAMLDHFAECIHNDVQPRTPGEEGLQDVRLMHLIYEAARDKTTVSV